MVVSHVLGVFAQPKSTQPLRLHSEQREITQCLMRAKFRESFCFDALAAATIDDLRRALLAKRYDVVHFAGHGDYDAPLIRWLVAAAVRFGVPRSSLSAEKVRLEAKAAKMRLLGASSDASTHISLERLLQMTASQPVGESLITLTPRVLEELGAGCAPSDL